VVQSRRRERMLPFSSAHLILSTQKSASPARPGSRLFMKSREIDHGRALRLSLELNLILQRHAKAPACVEDRPKIEPQET